MTISQELLDELLSHLEKADERLQGLMRELEARLMERMLGTELMKHLSYKPNAPSIMEQANRRNGTTRMTF